MRFNMLADSDWESGLDKVLNDISDLGYRAYFSKRDYGAGLSGVTVVFMCQDSALNLKRRVHYAKAEKKLYMDIMLDLPSMKCLGHDARKRLVVDYLLAEIPSNISEYKFDDFDSEKFISDIRDWCVERELC
jgi:hypothetical protein